MVDKRKTAIAPEWAARHPNACRCLPASQIGEVQQTIIG
jgi:hypothetical protein